MGPAKPSRIGFDEYDAGRADVMFVIQRVLEVDGKLTCLTAIKRSIQTRISGYLPRPIRLAQVTQWFYHGTQQINQGQWTAGRLSLH